MWDLMKYRKNTVAVEENNKVYTYEDLYNEGKKFTNKIRERSIIFIITENNFASLLAYSSCINNKIVPTLISSELESNLLCDLINNYSPEYIWISEEHEKKIDILSISKKKVYSKFGYNLFELKNKNYEIHDDLALLLTTSGSTGSPKLVRQSYENIYENAKSISMFLELDESEKAITSLPMNYTYGLSVINSHLLVGAELLLTNKSFVQKEFWEFFKKNKATSIVGVPYNYEILKKFRFFKMNLPSLRYMTQAGGKLSPELHKQFAQYAEDKKIKFFVMYGQTEATARMSYLPWSKSLEKYGSMGIAIPGGEFSIVDINGSVVNQPDVVGELVYKGKNVTLGYAESYKDLSLGDERKGILLTGDMAKFDDEGYYYIVGRKKRFLKIFGSRVNLDEIEAILKKEYTNVEIACAGVDDKLYVFTNQVIDTKKMKQFLSNKTKFNPIAFIIKTIEFIPKNESGKILYKKLEEYYD